jgi:hypothetical protein
MGLRIGTRSFLIKEYSIQQLGINDIAFENYTFQHRQQFFHISLVPVFPTGKFWTMREKGKLFAMDYEVPVHVEERIFQLGYSESKTLWYSYLLLLLIPFGIVFMGLQQCNNDRISNNNQEEAQQKLISKLDSLDKSTYLEFYFSGQLSGNILAQINTVKKDSIELIIPKFNQNDRYDNLSFSNGILKKFNNKDSVNLIWVSRNFLKESITVSNGKPNSKITTEGNISLREIKKYFGPIVLDEMLSFDYEKNIAKISLVNTGFDCKLLKSEIVFESGEKAVFSKTDFNKWDTLMLTLTLPKSLDEYTGAYLKEIGKLDCYDIIKNKNVKLDLSFYMDSFKIKNKHE